METKTGSALVIGAGISGIRSALDLAEMDYHVFLIDKSPHLGGVLSQLDYQIPERPLRHVQDASDDKPGCIVAVLPEKRSVSRKYRNPARH